MAALTALVSETPCLLSARLISASMSLSAVGVGYDISVLSFIRNSPVSKLAEARRARLPLHVTAAHRITGRQHFTVARLLGQKDPDVRFLLCRTGEFFETGALLGDVKGKRFSGGARAGVLHVMYFVGHGSKRLSGLESHGGLALCLQDGRALQDVYDFHV